MDVKGIAFNPNLCLRQALVILFFPSRSFFLLHQAGIATSRTSGRWIFLGDGSFCSMHEDIFMLVNLWYPVGVEDILTITL